MKVSVKEIAALVGGKISGDENLMLTGVAPLEEATQQDATFLVNPKLLKILPTTQAGVVLLKHGTPYSKTAVYVDNPQLAFAKILAILSKEKEAPREIHKTAVIAASAKIGKEVSIGANAVIEDGAVLGDQVRIGALCYVGARTQIGKNTQLYPKVTIREDCVVGERVILHPGVVIGADGFGFATEGGIHHKIPQVGNVILEDDVEIGANSTVDRAAIGSTVVGKGCKIDNLVQIAHNVKIGRGCIIVAQVGIAGSTTLGDYVVLGGQVAVNGHIHIGDRVMAAAQSGIPNSVEAGTTVFGTPARPIAEERRIQVIVGKLPKIYNDFKKIKKLLKLD